MNKKRIFVICVIFLLFITCYTVINTKYDRLARYPFGNESERKIIGDKLDDQEIEYIIEYGLEPDFFMDYIYCDKFNIYHVDLYNHFNDLFPMFTNQELILIVERLDLLNRANDEYYNNLLEKDPENVYTILRTYL